jgi:hypothetical protein
LYPRVKTIGGRQYVYLVSGVRSGGKVSQKTVAYLGPLSEVTYGIPAKVRREVARKTRMKVDWKSVSERISRMPVDFDDLLKSRRRAQTLRLRYASPRKFAVPRKRVRDPQSLLRERVPGELEALTRLAKLSFDSMFEQTGPREYRLRESWLS